MSLSKRSKYLLIGLLLAGIVGYLGVQYAFRPTATIEAKAVDFTGEAFDFATQVGDDPDAWAGKVLQLSGTISNITSEGFVMEHDIFCQMKPEAAMPALADGQKVTVKGHYIGFDDLLEEIKLDQCILVD